MSKGSKRNWAFVLYPESAPADWRNQLQQTGLPFAVSPYHDKDFEPDGTPKKPHYHIIACWPGPTTFNVARQLTERLNQRIPIPLDAVKGYYRYLTHLDNPDKYQYDASGITFLNGFNIADYCDLTSSERRELVKRCQRYIIELDILEYVDLLDSLMISDDVELYDFATKNTLLFNSYLTSRRYKRRDEQAALDRVAAKQRLNHIRELTDKEDEHE